MRNESGIASHYCNRKIASPSLPDINIQSSSSRHSIYYIVTPMINRLSLGERDYDEDLRRMQERIDKLERELRREKDREETEASLRRRRPGKKSSPDAGTRVDPPPPYDEAGNENQYPPPPYDEVGDEDESPGRNAPEGAECQVCRKKPADFRLSCDHYYLCTSCCGALRSCPECHGPIVV